MKKLDLESFGKLLILLGIVGFIAAVIIYYTPLAGMDRGALPAVSFLILLIGFSFSFPTLLMDEKGGLSTMRIVVFAVVLVFCTIYIKLGFIMDSFEQFTIDKEWVFILGLAFGAKAIQKYTEQEEEKPDKN
jgi:hypothetical protein